MSTYEERLLTADYNRLMNWLKHSENSDMLNYIEQTEQLFVKKADMFNLNDTTRKQRADLEVALELCKERYASQRDQIEAYERRRAAIDGRASDWTMRPRSVPVRNESTTNYKITLESDGMSRSDYLGPNRTIYFADPGETVIVSGRSTEVIKVPEGCKEILIGKSGGIVAVPN